MSELIPRLIRFKDAPRYLEMDKNRFNKEVRPYLTQIPIGTQGIAFDRLDLDAWVEQYKCRSGHLSVTNSRSMELWGAKYRQGSSNEATSGTFKNESLDMAFEKALAQSLSARQKHISRGASRNQAS